MSAAAEPVYDYDASDELRDERRDLVQRAGQIGVTLDGAPAVLTGAAMTLASVSWTEGPGPSLYVEWDRVPYILEHGGAFAS